MNNSRYTTQQKKDSSPKDSAQRPSDSVHLTKLGLEEFEKAKSDYFVREINPSDYEEDEFLHPRRKRRTLKELARAVPTSVATLRRFFECEDLRYDTAWAIAETLSFTRDRFHACVEERCPGQTPVTRGLETTSDAEDGSGIEKVHPLAELNLLLRKRHQLYQSLQEQTNQLTSSPLLDNSEPRRNREDLLIPLEVVKREKFPGYSSIQRQNSFEVPKGNDRTEINALHLKALLKELLEKAERSDPSGLRVAIVGNAGAGKTTFLQEFAEKIFEPPPDPEFAPLVVQKTFMVSR